MTREEQLKRDAKRQRERYQRMKCEGKCPDCAATILEESTTIFCVECTDRRDQERRRWAAENRERYLELHRKYYRNLTPAQMEARRESQRQQRLERKQLGLCQCCGKCDSRPGKQRCQRCSDQAVVAQKLRRERQRSDGGRGRVSAQPPAAPVDLRQVQPRDPAGRKRVR